MGKISKARLWLEQHKHSLMGKERRREQINGRSLDSRLEAAQGRSLRLRSILLGFLFFVRMSNSFLLFCFVEEKDTCSWSISDFPDEG